MINRRDLLRIAGLGMLAAGLPSLTFARAETDVRLVLVILRGAVDGLALAPPYGDGNYRRLRGELALPAPGESGGVARLDGLFGLHPSLEFVHQVYRARQALLVHATASPYRERSHFDGQDVLENGASHVGALRDGWLNRALEPLGGSLGKEAAIAMAQNTPLVLRGAQSVTSWAPSQLPDADDSTLERLQDLYADDDFFAVRLAQALKSQDIAEGMSGMDGRRRRGNDSQQLRRTMQAAARFLTAPDGPRIAVVEAGGWDTHANQGASSGQLANRFSGLDTALAALHDGLGSSWRDTAVLVATEFGRTVRVNGTRGTDHGTASAALLLGGAVDGGRIVADWPGLRSEDLYEDRDLRPTMDLRSLFKGVLAEHLGLSENTIESRVFPNSAGAPAMTGLMLG
ncbi:MAG: DUF1501 domain-containing protein [Woeseiaceae bacterium]|nr:DUF1501 domain-containing protein [Woeseiaceae bacterium]